MALYRSKPSLIEAVQWNGDNPVEVDRFVGAYKTGLLDGDLLLLAGKGGAQGWVPVPRGHWIVRQPGDPSDLWPVEPDYFAAKYERLLTEVEEWLADRVLTKRQVREYLEGS